MYRLTGVPASYCTSTGELLKQDLWFSHRDPVPVGSNECSDISFLKTSELKSNIQPRFKMLLDARVSKYLWVVAVHGSMCTSLRDKHICVHRELR